PAQTRFDETLERISGDVQRFRPLFTPGEDFDPSAFGGAIREARRGQLTAAQSRAESNLRETVAKRRLGGSSFATSEFSKLGAEFGLARAQSEAESFRDELGAFATQANIDLVNATAGIEREFREFGFAVNAAQGVAQFTSQNAQFQQGQAAAAQAGTGQLIGTIGGGILGFIYGGGPAGAVVGSQIGGQIGGSLASSDRPTSTRGGVG
ncbi:hypothetical protein LCGC14_3073270, partial [marine sediment metagenome]